jgi:uncharacterized iron-regulated protein
MKDNQKNMISKLAKVSVSTLIATTATATAITTTKLCNICTKNPLLCKCNKLLATTTIITSSIANAATIDNDLIDNNHDWYNPINERIFDTLKNSYIPAHPEILQKELKGRNIITIGEVHNNPCHHRLEFEVIKSLSNTVQPSNLAIGLECFYRVHQNALDRFIFQHKDFALLKKETNWQETWGYDLNMYAKIFQFACVNSIRIIGLNVPYEIAHMTSQLGYANLPNRLKEVLPDVDLNVQKHKDQFYALIGGHGEGQRNIAALERMYETQTLWDEYMAESAANYIKQQTQNNKYLVVIAGVGHVLGRVGIPDRIQKRTQKKSFVIVPQQVSWDSAGLPDVDLPLTSDDCDWCWYTELPLQADTV